MKFASSLRILILTTLIPACRAMEHDEEEFGPLAEQTRISRQIQRDHDFIFKTLWTGQLDFHNNQSDPRESEKLQEMAAYLEQERRERRNREAREAFENEKREREEAAQKWRKEFEAKQALRTLAWSGDYEAAMKLAVEKIEGRDDASPGKPDWDAALEIIDRIKGHGNWPHLWAHSLQVTRGYQAGVRTVASFLSERDGPPTCESVNFALLDLCEHLTKSESSSDAEGAAMTNVLANLHVFADQIPAPGLTAPTAAAIRKTFRLFNVAVPQATEAVIDKAMTRLPGTPLDDYWVKLCPPSAASDRGYNSTLLRVDAVVDVDQLLASTSVDEWRPVLDRQRTWRNDPASLATVRRLLKTKKAGLVAQGARHWDAEKVKQQTSLMDYYIEALTAPPGSETEKQIQRWEERHDVFKAMKNSKDAELALIDAKEGSYWGRLFLPKAVSLLLADSSPDTLLTLASTHVDFARTLSLTLEPSVSIKLLHALSAHATTPARLSAALAAFDGFPLESIANEDDSAIKLLEDMAYRLNNPAAAVKLGRHWLEASNGKRVTSHDEVDQLLLVLSVMDTLLAEKPSPEKLLEAGRFAIEIRANQSRAKSIEVPFDPQGVVLKCVNQLRRSDYQPPASKDAQEYQALLQASRGTADYDTFITSTLEPQVQRVDNELPFDTSLLDLLHQEATHHSVAAAALYRALRATPEWYPQPDTFSTADSKEHFSLRRRSEIAAAALLFLKIQRKEKSAPSEVTAGITTWLENALKTPLTPPGAGVVGRDQALGYLLTRALLSTTASPLDAEGYLSPAWLKEVDSLPENTPPEELYQLLTVAATSDENPARASLARLALQRSLETGAEAHPEYFVAVASGLERLPRLLSVPGVDNALRRELLESRLRWEFGRLNGFTSNEERSEAEVQRLGPSKAMTLALALEAAGHSEGSATALVIGDNPDFQWSLARAAARHLPDGILWLDRFSKGRFPANPEDWTHVKEGHLW